VTSIANGDSALTNENGLEQRRTWFRSFPAGTIEFVVVTRVLVTMLLLLLAVVQGTQRPFVLLALSGLLWIDYLLTMYWLLQLAADLNGLFVEPPAGEGTLIRRRLQAAFLAAVPATFLLLALSPWPSCLLAPGVTQRTVIHLATPLFGLAFLASVVISYRQLRRMPLGLSGWMVPALVPFLHWPALHRLLSLMHRRLCEKAQDRDKPGKENNPALAAAAADVLWGLSVLPWLIMLAVGLSHREWPNTAPSRYLPACGSILFGLFSIVDMAAMENVQRRFAKLIRGT
jgi:hypothetical protein